jgi:hypothetical protein
VDDGGNDCVSVGGQGELGVEHEGGGGREERRIQVRTALELFGFKKGAAPLRPHLAISYMRALELA